MPILTQCPHCQKKFRAPDTQAGKSVKCPGCQGVVRVPAEGPADSPQTPSQPASASTSWYILTENREQMGPVTKEQLDNLATKGRLSFCQIRRSDWRAWKWADDIYPDLPTPTGKSDSAARAASADDQDPARLVLCPDCGNKVSRRATGCPHCGCPAAVLLKQTTSAADGPIAARPPAPAATRDTPPATVPKAAQNADEPIRSRSWRRYAIAGGVLLAVVAMVVPLYIWWRAQSAVKQVMEQSGVPVTSPEPIPQPQEPGEELLSPEGKSQCIDEASRKMAQYIDEFQLQYHLPLSMLSQTAESVEMLKNLAGGNLDAIPDSTGVVPGGTGIEPYKSQANELFVECRDWVRKNVKRGPCTATDVWKTAREWTEQKRQAVLQPIGGVPPEDLTPAPIPEGP